MKAAGCRTLFDGSDLDKLEISCADMDLDGKAIAIGTA